ncbi:FixH family protein [Leucothrix pacifica]|uniref:Nitrogen fixation protein FixH n=1 Tax=Leucothrix pacifica TaxID=1247513 RepID=A0A317CPI6_9GAMM|nr:FixH family protein [Leucothrix pacifica]PWR00479.1 hypothetical protein DKW60_01250 [Leucothrix pacifica]
MANIHILITMGCGIAAAFLLFFFFHLGLKWSGRKSATLTVLIVWLVYIPLSYLYWPGIDVFAIHFAFFSMTAYGLGIVTYSREVRRDEAQKKGGWFHWVPASIVCFFLVLTIVDSNIIAIAMKYAPGVVAHDFRQKENQFNEYLQRLEVQKQRGWVVDGGWDKTPELNKAEPFEITVTDKDGVLLADADVEASYLSTADPRQDKKQVTLLEKSPGVYATEATLNVPGQWTIVVTIKRGNDVHEIKGNIDIALTSADS